MAGLDGMPRAGGWTRECRPTRILALEVNGRQAWFPAEGFPPPAFAGGTGGLAAQRCLTQCSCPVSLPDWRRRNRLCWLAPAAMQACRCSFVSAVLYSVEAAARRARVRSCAGVWGSIGLAKGLD